MGSLVSVIIPTYNRAGLVKRALESVLAQTYTDIEVIVVDDGSTDDTEQVMAKYTGRITYLKIPHRGYPGVSRNAGLQAAGGEFIAFLDDDDEWLPEKLEKQLAAIAEIPAAGFACTNAYRQHLLEARALFFKDRSALSGWLFSELLYENFVIASSMLVKKSVLKKAGMFDEQTWSHGVEDYDLWLRVALYAPGVYLCEALVVYYDSPTMSFRNTQTLMEHWYNLYRMLMRIERFVKQKSIALTMEQKATLLHQKRVYLDGALEEAKSKKFHFRHLRYKLLQIYWTAAQFVFYPDIPRKR